MRHILRTHQNERKCELNVDNCRRPILILLVDRSRGAYRGRSIRPHLRPTLPSARLDSGRYRGAPIAGRRQCACA
jgi:hypothetical protein